MLSVRRVLALHLALFSGLVHHVYLANLNEEEVAKAISAYETVSRLLTKRDRIFPQS